MGTEDDIGDPDDIHDHETSDNPNHLHFQGPSNKDLGMGVLAEECVNN